MTAIAPAPTPVEFAQVALVAAVRRTSALATLRALARLDVDRLLAEPASVRETDAWHEKFRRAHNTLWRREEHLIDAIDAERAARTQLTESQLQEGHLS
jgi:hypothetical protein